MSNNKKNEEIKKSVEVLLQIEDSEMIPREGQTRP